MGSVPSRVAGAPPVRFPGFDVLDQSSHWDPVTTGVVLSRVGMAPDIRFFTPTEQAIATALCDQLLGQSDDAENDSRVPIVNLIDARLAEQQTDGWHYHDMPTDGQARPGETPSPRSTPTRTRASAPASRPARANTRPA